MRKRIFLMYLSYLLGIKVVIIFDDKKESGYLDPPKNQFGDFRLVDKNNDDKLILNGPVKEIKKISLSLF